MDTYADIDKRKCGVMDPAIFEMYLEYRDKHFPDGPKVTLPGIYDFMMNYFDTFVIIKEDNLNSIERSQVLEGWFEESIKIIPVMIKVYIEKKRIKNLKCI